MTQVRQIVGFLSDDKPSHTILHVLQLRLHNVVSCSASQLRISMVSFPLYKLSTDYGTVLEFEFLRNWIVVESTHLSTLTLLDDEKVGYSYLQVT